MKFRKLNPHGNVLIIEMIRWKLQIFNEVGVEVAIEKCTFRGRTFVDCDALKGQNFQMSAVGFNQIRFGQIACNNHYVRALSSLCVRISGSKIVLWAGWLDAPEIGTFSLRSLRSARM